MRVVRGIDLDRPDTLTPEEAATFRQTYANSHGGVLDAYEFWLDYKPPHTGVRQRE
jgi:hypothetical protein